MKRNITVPTDAASICVFDPAVVETYPHSDLTKFDIGTIGGVRDGLFFGFQLGGDGVYQVQVTDADIAGKERTYACAVLETLGLRVDSGTVCMGGYGFQGDSEDFASIDVAPGQYLVSVYEVLWRVSPQWYRPDSIVAVGAPADYVIKLTPGTWPGPSIIMSIANFRLGTFYLPGICPLPNFLFDSSDRSIGTPPGMLLISTAVQSPKGSREFYLNECGVEGFKVDLDRYPGVNERDRIEFEVVSIDMDRRRFQGRYVRTLP